MRLGAKSILKSKSKPESKPVKLVRQQKLAMSPVVPPPTPTTTQTLAPKVISSPHVGTAIPDTPKASQARFTTDSPTIDKGEPAKGNYPMYVSSGKVDKFVRSTA